MPPEAHPAQRSEGPSWLPCHMMSLPAPNSGACLSASFTKGCLPLRYTFVFVLVVSLPI